MSDKRYIACIYENIYCYKMENKLNNIIILKIVTSFRDMRKKKKSVLIFWGVGPTIKIIQL